MIKPLLNYYKELSRKGLDNELPWLERKRTMLLGRLLLMTFIVCLPFTLPTTNPTTWHLIIIDCVVLLVLMIIRFRGKPSLASWLFIIYANLSLLNSSLQTDYYAGEHLYFILILAAAPLLLDYRKWSNILISSAITVVCYVGVQVYFWDNPTPNQIHDSITYLDHRINQLILLLGIFIISVNYFSITRSQQNHLLKTNKNLRKKEKALEEALAKAEANAKAKACLLSVMSHEIKTPLSTVIGLGESLSKKNINEESGDSLDLINFSANNILSIINNILDWSKIESTDINLNVQPVNLTKLLDLVAGIGGHMVQNKEEVSFVAEYGNNLPEYVLTDETRLTQVLVNLMNNAAKFTMLGQIKLEVGATVENETTLCLSFNVSDTGIGIKKEKQDYVFETFVQADESISRKYGGTGLGLAISKEIVGLLGGDLKLVSNENEGSLFSFDIRVPVCKAPEKLMSNKYDNEILKGKHVLIVDDDLANAVIAEKCVQGWGMLADKALSGNDAVKKAKEKKFDIVLMDISMPDIDGYEVTRILREEHYLDTPIIALAGFERSRSKEVILSSGMNDFITKPFKASKLHEIMTAHLSIIR